MAKVGKGVTGLVIEPGFIAAVETRSSSLEVERAAVRPLAPGLVRDGEIVDVAQVAEALRALFDEHKLSKRVRIGVANQRIVMRTIDLPPIPGEKELASAVHFQAPEYIPMPLDQAVLQHQSLGVVETPDGPRTRVVLVAARRDMVEKLLETVRAAGLRPHGIDLSAFAMIRSLHRAGRTDATVYISIGGVSNLAIATGPLCTFTRLLTHSCESMAVELAERRGLTLEHSRGWLAHVGLLSTVDDIEGDREIVLEARNVLSDGVRRIADEVRNSLDFYAMQHGGERAERAVITGPALALAGFSDQLGDALDLPVELGAITASRPGALADASPDHLAVAAGLTTEEVAA